MSGIVGIVRTDGAAVPPALIRTLTESLAFRGPDAQRAWHGGAVAFGHTLLRTTYEAEREEQPLSVGDVSIVADARIDARAELIAELGDTRQDGLRDAPDVELILRAQGKWEDALKEFAD